MEKDRAGRGGGDSASQHWPLFKNSKKTVALALGRRKVMFRAKNIDVIRCSDFSLGFFQDLSEFHKFDRIPLILLTIQQKIPKSDFKKVPKMFQKCKFVKN